MKERTYYLQLVVLLTCIFALFPTGWAAAKDPVIALVLGGGSARGFSHVGLIKALEENGVPVDLLVGTSMGSIIAGLYAGGYSVENMEEIVTAIDTAALLDIPLLPSGGVVDTTGLEHYLDVLLAQKTYNQLVKPFYSVAVNLATGAEVALHEGKVSKGIQASMSIPGIFPPVLIGDDYYVDGGVKNMVPADVAKRLGADIIIAVSLEQDQQDANHRRIMTNLRLALQTMIEGYTQQKSADADVLIIPEVPADLALDYQQASFLIEQGYQAGLAHLSQIKAVILARFPAFEFQPYAQAGCSSAEMQKIIAAAKKSVSNLPKRFSFKPELAFDLDYNFPKLGLKFTHGRLGRFGIGYRYGFHPDEGGHEIFTDWGHQNWGHFDLYLRQSPNRPQPTLGFALRSPHIWEATYASQGAKAWQISACDEALFSFPWGKVGLALRVTRMRATNAGFKESLVMAVAPQAQVFPWGEKHFPVGYILAKPYLFAGITIESPLTKLECWPAFRVGFGSQLLFFGLYPGNVSLGLQIDKGGNTVWKFGLKSIKF